MADISRIKSALLKVVDWIGVQRRPDIIREDFRDTAAAGEKGVKLSICSVFHNEEHHLPHFLGKLASFAGEVDELVVIDQGSTDRTALMLQNWGASSGIQVKIIREPHWGYCELSRQQSIDAARNPWVLVMDADEWFEPEANLALLASQCEADGISAVNFPTISHVADIPGDRVMNYFGDDGHIRLLRRRDVRWPMTPHVRPIVKGRVTTAREPNRKLHHLWYATTQRQKMERVLAAMRAQHEPEESLRTVQLSWEKAIRGFERHLGVKIP